MRASPIWIAAWVACASQAACAASVPLSAIQRIEVFPRGRAPMVVEGATVRDLLDGARCHEVLVLWKGGVPARVVLSDGRSIAI